MESVVVVATSDAGALDDVGILDSGSSGSVNVPVYGLMGHGRSSIVSTPRARTLPINALHAKSKTKIIVNHCIISKLQRDQKVKFGGAKLMLLVIVVIDSSAAHRI
jgi:hypothetical protein